MSEEVLNASQLDREKDSLVIDEIRQGVRERIQEMQDLDLIGLCMVSKEKWEETGLAWCSEFIIFDECFREFQRRELM